MYVIIIATFIIIIILFWDSILKLVRFGMDASLKNIYIWFILLLIINLIVISIIFGYYYYIQGKQGKDGLPGISGFPGQIGDTCYFTNPNGECTTGK